MKKLEKMCQVGGKISGRSGYRKHNIFLLRLKEHYKTKMIQQEHHKTEYHLCEVVTGISFCKLNIYISHFIFRSSDIL
jgi:hypothetical protein